MTPTPLPKDEFLHTFKLVPRLAISLVITKENKFLLTRRGIEPHPGVWHLPGSFVLKNEPLLDCVQRIAKNELDLLLEKHQIVCKGPFENLDKDPRGHVVDIIYHCKLEENDQLQPIGEALEAQFFTKMPTGVDFGHDKIVETVLNLG